MSNKRTGRMPPDHPDLVRDRSGGMCEGCLVRPAADIHHRRFLSRDGKHNLANLAHLCGNGNAAGCHGDAHSGACPDGWSISAWERRSEDSVPFIDLLGQAWMFDDHGGKHHAGNPDT